MRPYIICHMMQSIDGRIDCAMTEKIDDTDHYYEALDSLNCPSHLSGKITMAMHEALPGIFKAEDTTPIGEPSWHKATEAEGYTGVVDTKGTLLWESAMIEDKPLLCIVSQEAPKAYLDYLDGLGASWIAVGKGKIDLSKAMEILCREFGVERLAVVGGGHINGSMLDAGLLDEVSIMIGPAIDGRQGFAAVFDGLPTDREPFMLTIKDLKQYPEGTIWLRYAVK
ncbi:MAG: dihydrofolate reductase family protein [Bacteroidales bacterium]|nr:dihydrofolate reductase family protein [Bacteroidales bacterium]